LDGTRDVRTWSSPRIGTRAAVSLSESGLYAFCKTVSKLVDANRRRKTDLDVLKVLQRGRCSSDLGLELHHGRSQLVSRLAGSGIGKNTLEHFSHG
jgi:hypothetical protein